MPEGGQGARGCDGRVVQPSGDTRERPRRGEGPTVAGTTYGRRIGWKEEGSCLVQGPVKEEVAPYSEDRPRHQLLALKLDLVFRQ